MSPPVIWTFEPSVIVGVCALSLAYVCGWLRARQPGQPHPPGYDKLALFGLSMIFVLIALISPVDAWSTDFLFVHMIQHLLLLDAMPICLILSLSKGILRPVTRKLTTFEKRSGPIGHPVFALSMYIGMMIFWHVPSFYDDALQHPLIHVLEHACFAAAGTLYWWHLLSPIKARQHLDGMSPVMYMVTTKLTVGVLGVVLAFSPHSFYGWYTHHIHYLNLSPNVDQNLAGLVMALEQSIVMGIAVGYFFVRALNESEARQQRAERFALDGAPGPGSHVPATPSRQLASTPRRLDGNVVQLEPTVARREAEPELEPTVARREAEPEPERRPPADADADAAHQAEPVPDPDRSPV